MWQWKQHPGSSSREHSCIFLSSPTETKVPTHVEDGNFSLTASTGIPAWLESEGWWNIALLPHHLQSEGCAQADHALCNALPHLALKTFPEIHQGVWVFWAQNTYYPCMALQYTFPCSKHPQFSLFSLTVCQKHELLLTLLWKRVWSWNHSFINVGGKGLNSGEREHRWHWGLAQ